MAKIKRSQIATFMNVVPGGTADYKLVGVGVTDAKIEYNPKTTEETYIHEDSATILLESYAPTMGVEATAVKGDDVFDFLDTLRKDRAVLSDAETDIINVWLYETPTGDSYEAEQQLCSISIEDFGGAGGESAKINYTINFQGDPIPGDYDIVLDTFTPDS